MPDGLRVATAPLGAWFLPLRRIARSEQERHRQQGKAVPHRDPKVPAASERGGERAGVEVTNAPGQPPLRATSRPV